MSDFLFTLFLTLLVSLWFSSLVELIFIHLFLPFLFKIGITVFKTTIISNDIPFGVHDKLTIRKTEGKFKFVERKVYFLSRNKMFRIRLYTPFQFKAIGFFESKNKISIVGKIPISPISMIILVVLSLASLIIIESIGSGNYELLGILIFLILVLGMIITGSYHIEKKRFYAAVEELKELLSKSSDFEGNLNERFV